MAFYQWWLSVSRSIHMISFQDFGTSSQTINSAFLTKKKTNYMLSLGQFVKRSSKNTISTVRYYHDNIIDHYENPRNVGSFDKKESDIGTGLVGAPACGDVMKLQIKVDDNGMIIDSKFKTFGCGSAIASSSFATEWLKGKSVEECLTIKNTDIAKELKLPPVKLHCSMLAEDAIKAAIQDWRTKSNMDKKNVTSA